MLSEVNAAVAVVASPTAPAPTLPATVDIDGAWVAFRLLLQDFGRFRQAMAEVEAKLRALGAENDD